MAQSSHGDMEHTEFQMGIPSELPSPSKTPYHVVHIDIVSSSFFITPRVDQYLRLCAKRFSELISKGYPDIPVTVTYLQDDAQEPKRERRTDDIVQAQVYSNPMWWKCLASFGVHYKNALSSGDTKTSPFGRSWRSVLKIKRVFEGLRSCRAVISNLHMGLCAAKDQRFTEHQRAVADDSGLWPTNLRLGVPTLDPNSNFLLATPPSLCWAFSVALEYYRLLADEKTQRDDSNLTLETVGVLQNWVDFIMYGTLLKENSNKYAHINKEWLHSKASISQRASFWPPPLTIIVDCSDKENVSPQCSKEDEQLALLEVAWRNAIANIASEGHAIVLLESDIDQMQLSMANKIAGICQKRVAQAKAAISAI